MEKIREYLVAKAVPYYNLIRHDWGYYEDYDGSEHDVHLDTDGEIVDIKR